MAPIYGSETTAADIVRDVAGVIKGKVILTTGVSPGGLGAAFVTSIARAEPGLLILAGRSRAKTYKTVEAINALDLGVKVRVLDLDLSSLGSVRQAAATVQGWEDVPRIDVLVNNAGIMGVDYARTVDGFETTFAINHLGPFLFTNLIMSKLLEADAPRVVMLGSEGHRWSPIRWGDYDFQDGKTYNKWQAYGQAKTANMLDALALADKLGHGPKRLSAFCVHPGFSPTHLDAHIQGGFAGELPAIHALDSLLGNIEGPVPFRAPEYCAANHVFAAFSPTLDAEEHNGAYLMDCHIADPFTDTVKPWGTSIAEARRLWTLSEQLVSQKFEY